MFSSDSCCTRWRPYGLNWNPFLNTFHAVRYEIWSPLLARTVDFSRTFHEIFTKAVNRFSAHSQPASAFSLTDTPFVYELPIPTSKSDVGGSLTYVIRKRRWINFAWLVSWIPQAQCEYCEILPSKLNHRLSWSLWMADVLSHCTPIFFPVSEGWKSRDLKGWEALFKQSYC
jgi:hypothetical protein